MPFICPSIFETLQTFTKSCITHYMKGNIRKKKHNRGHFKTASHSRCSMTVIDKVRVFRLEALPFSKILQSRNGIVGMKL